MTPPKLADFFRKIATKETGLRERSVLSIGSRGYFENPTTDILAFYLDPDEIHELRELVLNCIFECVPEMQGQKAILEEPPIREYVTRAQNRIDLVVNGQDWLLVLENKLQHGAVNPFDEYRASIEAETRFGLKKKFYAILAPYRVDIPGWHWVDYRRLLGKIQGALEVSSPISVGSTSKWCFFLREWIIHVNEQAIAQMTDSEFDFVKLNYQHVVAATRLHEEYLQRLKDVVSSASHDAIGAPAASIARNNWGKHGIALRVFPVASSQRNVTLLVMPDGRFRVQFYVDHQRLRPESSREDFACERHFARWEDEANGTLWVYARDEELFADAVAALKVALTLLRDHFPPGGES